MLAVCDGAADDKTAAVAKLQAEYGVNAFFAIDEGPDEKDSTWTLLQVYQGGLGLPDRDYYFDEDKAEKRALYQAQLSAFGKVARIRGAFFWTLRMGSGWDPRPSEEYPKGRQINGTSASKSVPGYPFQVWSLLEMARLGVATALNESYPDVCE